MATTTIDEQIAKLEAKRAALTAAQDQATAAFKDNAALFIAEFERAGEDVEAVRDLPDLLRQFIASCREYHRIVNDQRLSRLAPQEEVLPGFTTSTAEELALAADPGQ